MDGGKKAHFYKKHGDKTTVLTVCAIACFAGSFMILSSCNKVYNEIKASKSVSEAASSSEIERTLKVSAKAIDGMPDGVGGKMSAVAENSTLHLSIKIPNDTKMKPEEKTQYTDSLRTRLVKDWCTPQNVGFFKGGMVVDSTINTGLDEIQILLSKEACGIK